MTHRLELVYGQQRPVRRVTLATADTPAALRRLRDAVRAAHHHVHAGRATVVIREVGAW